MARQVIHHYTRELFDISFQQLHFPYIFIPLMRHTPTPLRDPPFEKQNNPGLISIQSNNDQRNGRSLKNASPYEASARSSNKCIVE
jgi:hypothetical protein